MKNKKISGQITKQGRLPLAAFKPARVKLARTCTYHVDGMAGSVTADTWFVVKQTRRSYSSSGRDHCHSLVLISPTHAGIARL